MKKMNKIISSLLAVLLSGCTAANASRQTGSSLDISTQCDDKACVADYLHEYNHLPDNYMTKEEAREEGWTGGALHLEVPGKSIGGDVFSNYEGTLPEDDTYHECDIDTSDSFSRGDERIVWSEDGDIWYTDDHYETWTLLYGDGD